MGSLTLGQPINSWRIAPAGITQDRANAHWHKHQKWCRQYGWTGWKTRQERLSEDGFVDQVECNGRIIDAFRIPRGSLHARQRRA